MCVGVFKEAADLRKKSFWFSEGGEVFKHATLLLVTENPQLGAVRDIGWRLGSCHIAVGHMNWS